MKLKRKSVFSMVAALVMVAILTVGTLTVFALDNQPAGAGFDASIEVDSPSDDTLAAVLRQYENVRVAESFNMATPPVFPRAFNATGAVVVSTDVHFCDDSCDPALKLASISYLLADDIDIEQVIADIESGKIQAATEANILALFESGATLQSMAFIGAGGVSEAVALNNSPITALQNCDHNYVLGIFTVHVRFSDGSCAVENWDALRCSRCGDIWLLAFRSASTFRVCPH